MKFVVDEVKSYGGYVLHVGQLESGSLKKGDKVVLEIDIDTRRPTMANHTSTHMVNFALRQVLGNGVEQQGSVVTSTRLRFDYSHNHAPTKDQIYRVEKIVCDMIAKELKIYSGEVPLPLAKSITGIRAMFGEKYPNPVRVVSIGVSVDELVKDPSNKKWFDYAIELCGGTHLSNSKEADLFAIVKEYQKSQGVRRIVAVTGDAAIAAFQLAATFNQRLDGILKGTDEKVKHYQLIAFAEELNHAKIPVWKKLEMKETIAPILKAGTSVAVQAAKDALASSADHSAEVAAKLKAENISVWVEHFDVGGNQEALHKARLHLSFRSLYKYTNHFNADC